MKPRYKKRVPLISTSVIFSNSEFSGEGQVLDFGTPGCLIDSSKKVAKGQYLQLEITLPGLSLPLNVKLAAVRWANGTRFGLEFIKMDTPNQETLNAFITRQMKDGGAA